ncbi:hypothetical protein FB451DRAFT_1393264 [Mycena latifolia]|nr:hypothetical protein FB451DRAFT_1393264 [Mycena latifolia]
MSDKITCKVTIRHALTNDRLWETAAFATIGVIEGLKLDLFPKDKYALAAALVPLALVCALYVNAIHIVSVDDSRRDKTGPLFNNFIVSARTLLARTNLDPHVNPDHPTASLFFPSINASARVPESMIPSPALSPSANLKIIFHHSLYKDISHNSQRVQSIEFKLA